MNDENDDMPMDADLDLLESYLDRALAPAQSASLLVRLSVDAGLAATLDALRAERAARSAVWAALEPDDRTVEQLVWRVRGAVAAELNSPAVVRSRWGFAFDPWRVTRFTGAAAACVVLGFLGGRIGRGPGVQSPVAAVTHVDGPVDVPVANEYGQIVTTQQFKNADEFHRFMEDLHQAHDGPSGSVSDGSNRLASELRY